MHKAFGLTSRADLLADAVFQSSVGKRTCHSNVIARRLFQNEATASTDASLRVANVQALPPKGVHEPPLPTSPTLVLPASSLRSAGGGGGPRSR